MNQLNYVEQITSLVEYRPERPSRADINLTSLGTEYGIFGTRDTDHLEMWVYNYDGSFAGHLNVPPTDESISYAVMNEIPSLFIDLDVLFVRMGINPGKYTITLNFFRNEVGSETGYKLFISQMSPDRTELQLKLADISEAALNDLYEFVVPSVPKSRAAEILEEVFASIDHTKLYSLLKEQNPNIIGAISYADMMNQMTNIFEVIRERTHPRIIEYMNADTTNFAIQDADMRQYVRLALRDVISDINDRRELDSRIVLK